MSDQINALPVMSSNSASAQPLAAKSMTQAFSSQVKQFLRRGVEVKAMPDQASQPPSVRNDDNDDLDLVDQVLNQAEARHSNQQTIDQFFQPAEPAPVASAESGQPLEQLPLEQPPEQPPEQSTTEEQPQVEPNLGITPLSVEQPGPVDQAILNQFAQEPPAQNASAQPPQPIAGRAGRKESAAAQSQELALEAAHGVQVVETEITPELNPEVESYIQQVNDQTTAQVQEIVIAGQNQPLDTSKYASRPVIVIPISPETEKTARLKSPSFSIRWLVEWSRKIIKMFSGKVIYQTD